MVIKVILIHATCMNGEADYCHLLSMYAYMHLAFKEILDNTVNQKNPLRLVRHGLINMAFFERAVSCSFYHHFNIKYLLIPLISLVYRHSRDYAICALYISQSLITCSQFIYGYRRMKTPSTDKFSRRLVCRIVNYTQFK